MPGLNFLSAVSMAERISRKQLSPIELVECHLVRIQELNAKLNAFVQVDSEGARRQAQKADEAVRNGETLGPLHGVPISIKASIEVAGLRCESGSKLRQGLVASHDAPLVSRLRQAGAIILGVTNSPELLMAWETDNVLYGRTNSPWDLERRNVGGRRRKRWWRIHSRPGTFQRDLRAEADSRPHTSHRTFSCLRGAFRPDRRGRADGQDGC
jgi:amidase